jgi:LysM repeat protein
MKITVLNNQSLYDIAVRYLGTVDAAYDLAEENNLKIDQDLFAGQILKLPKKDYGFKEVVKYFDENNIQPATAASTGTGIDYMTIGVDFMVSPDQEGINIWAIEDDFIVQPNI